jgi:hypothetical protein
MQRFFWWLVCEKGCSIHVEGEDPTKCPVVKCPFDGTALRCIAAIKDLR